MSKFFAQGSSSEEEDTSEDETSEEEEEVKKSEYDVLAVGTVAWLLCRAARACASLNAPLTSTLLASREQPSRAASPRTLTATTTMISV